MYRKEVNERSPLRVFERSIHGGLGRGNLGVVISRAGVGKSAFLIGIAIDDLLRERTVLHVSIGDSVDHVRNFYNESFLELARTTDLIRAGSNRLRVERLRHIHSYQPGTFSVERLCEETVFLREHADFTPRVVIIDNFPFADSNEKEMAALKRIARDLDAEVWFSALSHRDTEAGTAGFPDPVSRFNDFLSVKLYLEPVGGAVRLRLMKDHENDDVSELMIELDPKTLLLRDAKKV